MATSQVAQVAIHCVDAAGTGPVLPYSSWATAATNIQDAINAASAGELVLVTNGIFSYGGKVMEGDLTNRVVLDKALTVMSVNGYAATMIQGAWDSLTTNGPGAVRCAWLTNGATLSGFTLRGGATRATGPASALSGGGATVSDGGTIANCLISNNAAAYSGGGVNGSPLSTVRNCQFLGNCAQLGGGSAGSSLYNCFLQDNSASFQGGGAYVSNTVVQCTIANCTIVGNSAIGYGGGLTCSTRLASAQGSRTASYTSTLAWDLNGQTYTSSGQLARFQTAAQLPSPWAPEISAPTRNWWMACIWRHFPLPRDGLLASRHRHQTSTAIRGATRLQSAVTR